MVTHTFTGDLEYFIHNSQLIYLPSSAHKKTSSRPNTGKREGNSKNIFDTKSKELITNKTNQNILFNFYNKMKLLLFKH